MMLRATFVAVPAFNLVDPVKSSGPTASVITRSTFSLAAGVDRGRPESAPPATAGLQVSKIVFAPNDFRPGKRAEHKRRSAARRNSNHNIATFYSALIQSQCAGAFLVFRAFHTSVKRRYATGDDSLHQIGDAPNVGGISLASRTPRRPLLPAPT